MKNVFLIVFSTISIFSFGQLSSNKQKLIQPLLKIDYAESENVGAGGEYSEVYRSFANIKGKLTNQDLLILAKNSSNSLRFYSCIELVPGMKRRSAKDMENVPFSLLYHDRRNPTSISSRDVHVGVDLS